MANRNINIELVRIVSMFLIVMGHIFVGFIPLGTNGSTAFRTDVPHLIFFISFHVNLFVLISGYCGIKSLKSVLKTWKLVFSYLVLIALMNLVFSWGSFDYSSLLFSLSGNPWWFMHIYVLLALLAPTLLEPLLSTINKGDLLKLAGILLLIDVYFGFICHVETVHNGGYDLIHFVTVYIIGGYLRTLDVKHLAIKGHLLKARHFVQAFVIVIVLKLVWHLVVKSLGFSDWFVDYNHPFNIALAVCAFLWFLNLNITNTKIQFVSSSVISVYLLQEHPLIGAWLMKEFDVLVGYCHKILPMELLLIPLFVVAIFIPAILIDKIRLKLVHVVEGIIAVNCRNIKNHLSEK